MGKNWWILILLTVVLGALLRVPLLILVGLLLSATGGASALWAHYCLASLSYRRQFSATHLFYGDEIELAIQIENAKPLPLAWLIAVDEFPQEMELLSGQLATSHRARRRLLVNSLSLRWYERVTRRYRLRGYRRGEWSFGPVQLSSGDIFGFSVRRHHLSAAQTVVVYPRTLPLSQLNLPDRHPFGEFPTTRRLVDDPVRVTGAREYVPGDNFRHIHWKASAHHGELLTRLFEPSASRPLALFLNARTYAFINEGIDREILELAAVATASIAHWAWEEGYPVGLYVNSVIRASRERVRIPPGNQPDQLRQILEALARMEDDGLWTLATILDMEGGALNYGSTVVVVTPLLNDRLLRSLLDLRRREHSVTLITLGRARLKESIPGIRTYHLGGREAWHALERLELAS